MRFTSTLLIVLAIIVAAFGAELKDEASIRTAFGKFLKDFDKVYTDNGMTEVRYQFFRANYLRAVELNERLNARRGTTGLKAHGVTKFMDLSPEEMKQYFGYIRSEKSQRNRYFDSPKGASKSKNSDVPAESDWTKVKGVTTAVRDQGQCGSCWAFSAGTAIEGAAGMLHRNNSADSYISMQQIVDCDRVSHGCRGGDLPPAFDYISRFGGVVAESAYPYTASDGTCKDSAHSIEIPVTGYEWVIEPCQYTDCSKQDEFLVAEKVAERGPAAVCVAATNDWFSYTGPEPYEAPCDNDYYALNHCVTLEGVHAGSSAADSYYIVRNSWGTSWGADGFIYLPFGENKCGVVDEIAFALVE